MCRASGRAPSLREQRPQASPVRAIAFSPDGSRLASGGADGSLRIWDVARGILADILAGNADRPNPINTLAYSPDGLSIVAGFEAPGLALHSYQAGNVAAPPVSLPTLNGQGPVEFVAYHPDAARPRLAVSIKSDASLVPDPMRMSCDVEIRDMPGGQRGAPTAGSRVGPCPGLQPRWPPAGLCRRAGPGDPARRSGRAGPAAAPRSGRREHAV